MKTMLKKLERFASKYIEDHPELENQIWDIIDECAMNCEKIGVSMIAEIENAERKIENLIK